MENKELKLKWHTEQRKIDDLIPFEKNPRRITETQKEDLQKSLEKFDLVEIPAIDTDNKIVAGHQRLKIMQLIGKGGETIDVRVPNRKLTDEEFQEYNLRSNKNTGEWDHDLLKDLGEDILTDVGFEREELDNIFGIGMAEDFNQEEEMKKAVKDPRGVETGDLWKLGEHRLVIGDSTDRKNWEKLLGEERFDFMFTDPPYRLAYCKKRTRKVKTKDGWKNKREREYQSVGETDKLGKPKGFGAKQDRTYEGIVERGVPEFDEWLSIANEFQNQKGSNVMIFENWRNVHDLWEAIEKYWKIKNMVIWWLPNRMQGFSAKYKFFNKYDIAPLAGEGIMNEEYEIELDDYLKESGQKLLDSYEVCIYGNQGKDPTWTNHKKGTRWAKVSDHITGVASTASSGGQNLVFGTKPIPVLVPYVKILSPRDGIVMEPFGGSGSTIIASEIMKRKCRAIEMVPMYGEVIIRRFEKFTGIKAVKLN